MPLVFQYGSNCNAERLNAPERLAGGADDQGRAETIEEFDIAFNVWSQTNRCAASDLVRVAGTGHRACGVLYEVPSDLIRGKRNDRRKTLEQIEGKRYGETSIQVRNKAGEEVRATTFLVNADERRAGLWTSRVYVEHIVTGLRDHDISEEYVQRVIDIAIRTNNEASDNAREQSRLIEQLRRK